jgi:AcrR family transcriptional regulator
VSVGGATGRRPGHRPGRPRGAASRGPATRDRIVEAARAAFAEHGFDGATVRTIAARAAVDPALVHHYFGTKQRLFMTAMQFPIDVAQIFPAVAPGPRDEIGERLIRHLVEIWDRPEVLSVILGIVRSAATDDAAAGMLRSFLIDGPLAVVGGALHVPDGPLRATLAGTQMVGLVLARYVIRVEPLASLPGDRLAVLVGPSITRYLTGDLGGAAAPADRGRASSEAGGAADGAPDAVSSGADGGGPVR